jgi:hypothetical protein
MAAIVILWPEIVTTWLDKHKSIDLDKVKIEVPVQQEPELPSELRPAEPLESKPDDPLVPPPPPDSGQEAADAIQRDLLKGIPKR